MEAPLITIFVRHSQDCKYVGDEFCKRCRCNKHLRWSMHGKQYRKKTGSRSWAGAEDAAWNIMAQAEDLLEQAEGYYVRRVGDKAISTAAREAVQTAEDARLIAMRSATAPSARRR